MGKPVGNTGITRLINAARFSWQGFRAAFKHEEAFRQEVLASLIFIPLALYLGENGIEKAILLGAWMLVPVVELLNSAVEAAVDRIGEEPHKLSGRAKDIGSAAVLLALINAAVIWGLVLWP